MDIAFAQQLESLTSAIQSIVLSVGAIIGGFWAYRKFKLLDEVNKTTLERNQLEIENSLFRRKLHEFPAINISVESKQINADHTQPYLVEVNVTIRNVGDESVKMNLEKDSLALTKIHFNDEGDAIFGDEKILNVPSSDDPNIPLSALILRSGDNANLSTVAQLQNPGLYLTRFYSKQSAKVQKKAEMEHGKSDSDTYRGLRWGESSVFLVAEPSSERIPG